MITARNITSHTSMLRLNDGLTEEGSVGDKETMEKEKDWALLLILFLNESKRILTLCVQLYNLVAIPRNSDIYE